MQTARAQSRHSTTLAAKKTAARGSPPAATGLAFNRICSLPVNLFEKPPTAIPPAILLQASEVQPDRGLDRIMLCGLGGGGACPSAGGGRPARAASGSCRVPAACQFPCGAIRPVGLHLLPLLRRQLAADCQQEARIRLFQLGPRLRNLVDLRQNLRSRWAGRPSSAAPAPAPPSPGWPRRSISFSRCCSSMPSIALRCSSVSFNRSTVLGIVPPAPMVALRPKARSIGGRCSPNPDPRPAAAGPCAIAVPASKTPAIAIPSFIATFPFILFSSPQFPRA